MYNEAIIFDIPPENVEQVSLSIAVMDYDRYVRVSVCSLKNCHVESRANQIPQQQFSCKLEKGKNIHLKNYLLKLIFSML